MAIARWLAPVFAAALAAAAALAPAPAQAQSQSADLVRTIVNIADVVFRGNQPYYRHGDYGRDDRLVMSRDRYGRPVYHRIGDRYGNRGFDGYGNRGYDRYGRGGYDRYGRSAPPYGRAYGYYGDRPQQQQRTRCGRDGRCRVEYYDPRHDRRRHDNRYNGYGRWQRDDDDD